MPTYKMPDERASARGAAVAAATDALAAARCSIRLAGERADDFVVRELLLAVLGELDWAASALRRLC